MTAALTFIPATEAMDQYPCPGLTPDLVVYLAKHHGLLLYVDHPRLGLLVHEDQYQRVAQELQQVRNSVQGYVRSKDALDQFGYNARTLYKLIEQGYIRKGSQRGELLHEDVAFFARLAEIIKLPMGKSFLPPSYSPGY